MAAVGLETGRAGGGRGKAEKCGEGVGWRVGGGAVLLFTGRGPFSINRRR